MDIIKDMQLKNSLIPSLYLKELKLIPDKPDVDNFKKLKEIENNSADFVNKGNNLLINSLTCGNGKTSWACKIAKTYIDQYSQKFALTTPVLFVNVPEYIYTKKSAMSNPALVDKINEMEYNMMNAKLVIWDDVATKLLSEYDTEHLYVFINNRMSNEKANIFTSNVDLKNMARLVGNRLYSRIVQNSVVITLVGTTDNRGGKFELNSASVNK